MALAPDAANAAAEPEDEELIDVPQAEKEADPLNAAEIQRSLNGETFYGRVEEIEMGMVSREKLYRIRYEDGDVEHFSADQVLQCQIKPADQVRSKLGKNNAQQEDTNGAETRGPLKRPADPSAELPVAKRPAAATGDPEEEEGDAEDEDGSNSGGQNGVFKKPANQDTTPSPYAEENEEDEDEQEGSEPGVPEVFKKPAEIAEDEEVEEEDTESIAKKPASSLTKRPAGEEEEEEEDEEDEEPEDEPAPVLKKPASASAGITAKAQGGILKKPAGAR